MNYEEFLAKLKEIYNTTLEEDINITKEIEELSNEKHELCANDNILKLEEKEYILKNGKTFRGKLKSFIGLPYGDKEKTIKKIVLFIIYLVLLTFLYGVTFSIGFHYSIDTIIAYIFDAFVTVAGLTLPVCDIIYINKVNKKYKLEDVSLELANVKKRNEEIIKELKLKKSLHEIKKQKLIDLKTTIQNVTEVLNAYNLIKENTLTGEQVMNINRESKEEGKKLKLERK